MKKYTSISPTSLNSNALLLSYHKWSPKSDIQWWYISWQMECPQPKLENAIQFKRNEVVIMLLCLSVWFLYLFIFIFIWEFKKHQQRTKINLTNKIPTQGPFFKLFPGLSPSVSDCYSSSLIVDIFQSGPKRWADQHTGIVISPVRTLAFEIICCYSLYS